MACTALTFAFLCVCADRPVHRAPPADARLVVLPSDTRLVVLPADARRLAAVPTALFVEVVATDGARRKGLGGRTSLPPDGGMLFVYRDDVVRNFWMKDCLIGLDIAYVRADGTIARIATLPPGAGLPNEQIPHASSKEPVRYVLEADRHWFAQHGVGEGDRVDLSAVLAGVVPE